MMPTPTPQENQNHLMQAREFKDLGNGLYGEEDYKGAVRAYHKCLLHARAVQNMAEGTFQKMIGGGSVEGEQATSNPDDTSQIEAQEIVLKCYNNLAACILFGPNRNSDDYVRAADYCNRVLEKEPNNEKALFRKAKCLFKAGDYEKAKDIFVSLEKNKEVKECNISIQEDRKRRDEEWRRNVERVQAAQQLRLAQQAQMEAGQNEPGPAHFENGTMPNGEIHSNENEA